MNFHTALRPLVSVPEEAWCCEVRATPVTDSEQSRVVRVVPYPRGYEYNPDGIMRICRLIHVPAASGSLLLTTCEKLQGLMAKLPRPLVRLTSFLGQSGIWQLATLPV
jgi:hypothetical protein